MNNCVVVPSEFASKHMYRGIHIGLYMAYNQSTGQTESAIDLVGTTEFRLVEIIE